MVHIERTVALWAVLISLSMAAPAQPVNAIPDGFVRK